MSGEEAEVVEVVAEDSDMSLYAAVEENDVAAAAEILGRHTVDINTIHTVG
jgi:hypothetical protein